MWRPLALVLGAGFALRLFAMIVYPTTAYNWGDSLRFVRLAPFAPETGIFEDPWMPAGYPLFLRAVRALTDWLPATIAVQHLLGLVTALLLYVALRRLDAPRWAALVPAAVIALSGDAVYGEQAVLTEWMTVFVLAAGLCLLAVARSRPSIPRFALAGAVLAMAGLVRNVALAAAAVAIAWVLLFGLPELAWRRRAVLAGTAGAAAVAVVVGYVVLATSIGPYSGLADLRGWFLYARTAPIADCSQFTPPRDLRILCERSDPATRRGPFHYVNHVGGPGRYYFDLLPWACAIRRPPKDPPCETDEAKVGSFGRRVVLNQPADYARIVVKDLVRFVDPDFGTPREAAGSTPPESSFSYRDAATAEQYAGYYRQRYTGVRTDSRRGRELLETYQSVFRVEGLLLVLALLAAVAGAWRGREGPRRATLLFLGVAAVLYLVPVLSFSYDHRYGMVAQPFLMAAGALGAWALHARGRVRKPVEEVPHLGARRASG